MNEPERRHHPSGVIPWGRRAVVLTGPQNALVRHAWAYVGGSVFLCLPWRMTDTAYFTPELPVLGWGLGVAIHAWVVFVDTGSRRSSRMSGGGRPAP